MTTRMRTTNIYSTAPVALAMLFAAGLGLASRASAAPIDDAARQTRLAAQLLQDAASARRAVVDGSVAAADRDIAEALDARAGMAALAKNAGSSAIVPLYAQLDDTTVISQALERRRSAHATGSGAERPVTVRGNLANLTYVAIDLDKARSRLEAARLALRDHNRQAAEDSLGAIGSDLIVYDDATRVPLLTALQDLELAHRALLADRYGAARLDLRQASEALKTYDASGNGPEARSVAAQIDRSNDLNANDAPTASQKIDAWWESVERWFARSA
jgi:hypothetical protein